MAAPGGFDFPVAHALTRLGATSHLRANSACEMPVSAINFRNAECLPSSEVRIYGTARQCFVVDFPLPPLLDSGNAGDP